MSWREEKLVVRLEWGITKDIEAELRDGERYMFETDGPYNYRLFEVDWDQGVLTIRPKSLMISANPDSLRRYADILEDK